MAAASALEGIRVIDFGQYIAGPFAAMLLADQGADVIRIDPPGGPRYQTPANATWNRNKRSIVLDLKTAEGLQTAQRLIASADVVIENFRPGVMDRLGLGAATVCAEHPRLVYCSLPGFGHDDPRAGVAAWEGVLGAATGAYRPPAGSTTGRPVYTVIPFSSAYAAFLSAVSITMALNARQRSGLGQRIEMPLYDATFTALSNMGIKVHNAPPAPKTFEWSRQLPTKDGRWFRYFAGNKKFEDFIQVIGMAKVRDAGASDEELGRRFDEIFRTRTAAEWEIHNAELGTEGATCHTSAEWLEHPHALGSDIIADFDDPELGRFCGPGINVRLADTPGAVRKPRSLPDADRASVLQDLARAPAALPAPTEQDLRSALQGVRVLDLCIILAGPTCGRTLAEFGADVIKIDSPHRNPVSSHNDINRGKRSLLLDLKTREGLAIFWKLVDQADVILQNYRMGVAESLGIGYEQIKARRPGIVYCSLNTFGQYGPYATRPGHESIAQAMSGMMVRYGSEKPALAPFAANDYGTGLMGAYAISLALFHRQHSGRGQHVDTALAFTATMLQSGLLQSYPGKQWDEPHGQEALGHHALYRLYQAADGWFFLAAQPGQLAGCAVLADLASLQGPALAQALEQRLAARPADEWVKLLTAAGIGAHRVVSDMVGLLQDPLVKARGLSVTREHDDIGPVTTTAPGPRLSRTPVQVGRPAPRPGSDAREVLREIGMKADYDRLVRERVIVVDGIAAG
jgi:crotonobetainyl-CoA:carnitine CoA-transferase CaiB-like acyl-CoA transferase